LAEVLMPRLSDTMEEGTVAKWLKRPGERVSRGDVLAEIDTDKATMDLESYEEGVLESLLVEEGSTVPIGTPLAVVTTDADAARSAAPAIGPPPPATHVGTDGSTAAALAPSPLSPPPEAASSRQAPSLRAAHPPRSSPLARRIARRYGIDLTAIRGTGPAGRVVRADVEKAAAVLAQAAAPSPASARAALSPPAGEAEVEEVPLSNLRKVTAERLAKSLEAPHFYLTRAVDAAALASLRAELSPAFEKQAGLKLTLNDLVLKACAKTLRAHPEANSAWGGDKILRHRRVNIGIAVAVPDGLVVPVVKDADKKSLAEIASEARALAGRAREGKLALEDISGGTFTVSNLGMFGIDQFTAVLNPPQAAILAVGAAKAEPVVREGELAISTVMRLTLSIDHRVLDGATGAVFLGDLTELLEHPLRIMI
jgi:pyruvate dehydrogenase E2 component (dihydrolipoamide acetyltransferase)